MPTPLPSAPDPGPLTSEQKQELARAHERVRDLLRPARSSERSAGVTGVLAGLSLLFGLASVASLLVGLGLAVVAWNEWRGARLLKRLDLRGPRLLARNQLGFMALLVAYGLWGLYSGLTEENPYAAYPELSSMLPSTEELHMYTWALYGGLIVLAPLFQGRRARCHFAHEAKLRTYLDETPDWIVELQRSSLIA